MERIGEICEECPACLVVVLQCCNFVLYESKLEV